MGKTRSLAPAQAGPIGPSHHMEYFLLFFWKRLPTGEPKKMKLGNKERPNIYILSQSVSEHYFSAQEIMV